MIVFKEKGKERGRVVEAPGYNGDREFFEGYAREHLLAWKRAKEINREREQTREMFVKLIRVGEHYPDAKVSVE